jgi:ankyrin repeat protein
MTNITLKKEEFSKSDYVSKFLLAAYEGNLEFIEFCILQGFSPNAIDEKGRTPLMVASFKGRERVVRYLLENRADVTVQDNEGNNALNYAETGENESILFLLRAQMPEE